MSVFSERLTALMKAKGFSQKDFAKKANITESAMSYYAKGVRTPSGEVLARIAKALDTTADYLLGSTDNAEQLKKAEEMLKLMFNDIFEDDDEE